MAKDPAVLFYTQDFIVGTAMMTAEEKGYYITLLCFQHQKKRSLTLLEIEKIIGSSFKTVWPGIMDKFEQDESGFFNVRMREESEKRSQFSKSRAENRKKKTSVEDMNKTSNTLVKDKENENENEDTVLNKGGMGGIEIALGMNLPINVLEAAEMNQFTLTKKNNTEFIKSQWKVFLSERINEPTKKYYRTSDLTSHFLNWIRNKHPKNNGTHQQPSTNRKSAGAAKLIDLLQTEIKSESGGEYHSAG